MSSKEPAIRAYILRLQRELGKDNHLDEIKKHLILIPQDKTYDDMLMEIIKYFSSASTLSGVDKVYRQGVLIRPQFSGHRKRYEKPAIGLTVSILGYDKTRGTVVGVPLNVDELRGFYQVDIKFVTSIQDILDHASWFIDLSQIYPFTIVRIFKILYSSNQALRTFLRRIYGNYGNALRETFKHLKVPDSPTVTEKSTKYLVLYRCQRSFVSSVISPDTLNSLFNTGIDKLILSNTVAYLLVSDALIAYYYSLILNYLVHKVNTFGGSFILNQYGRPIETIREADLEWYGYEWQVDIAELSSSIHEKVRPIILDYLKISNTSLYEVIDRGEDIKVKRSLGKRVPTLLNYLLSGMKELSEAFAVIDEHVDETRLRRGLRRVAFFKENKRRKTGTLNTFFTDLSKQGNALRRRASLSHSRTHKS